jgi:hypothetical protein
MSKQVFDEYRSILPETCEGIMKTSGKNGEYFQLGE